MRKILDILNVLKEKRMWINLLFGFSAGLPIMLVLSIVKIWARREGIELSTIGLLGWISLPYSLNFLMGPILDRFILFKMGRRRSWILTVQIGLAISIFSIGFCSPKLSMSTLSIIALLVAIFSATQDVAIDAYRREILLDKEIGMGSSLYVYGYRVAMLVSSGGGLWLVDPSTLNLTFSQVFHIMGLLMGIGIITTFISNEPKISSSSIPSTIKSAVIKPFKDFIKQKGIKPALIILSFIFFYKFGDALAGTMLGPFYVDMGYSNKVIAEVTKGIGFFSSMGGLAVGAIAIFKWGIVPCLFLFGILQCISTSLFSILLFENLHQTWQALALVVGFEDFSSGLGTTALVSFMATMTNKQYTATQYALFASLAALGKTLFGGFSGYIVEAIGFEFFFYIGSILAIPGLYLAYIINKRNKA